MRVVKFVILLFISFLCCRGYAETCVKTSFNVRYTCNGGTLVGTLPADTTFQYGKQFTPSVIGEGVCAPPEGKWYVNGITVIVDGEEVAYTNDTSSYYLPFSVYYTSDIEIGPRWVSEATVDQVRAISWSSLTKYSYTETGGWTVIDKPGVIRGVGVCSSYQPLMNVSGLQVPSADSDLIEDNPQTGMGAKCYCKLIAPYSAQSSWVYVNSYGSCSLSLCGKYCAEEFIGNAGKCFQAALFSGIRQ